jgi:4-alpha-glucanotransferase
MTTVKESPRSSGILLHPTSLPGPYGIGDLGLHAYHWIDTLVDARQKWWQILPLTPTGLGDSPYSSFSAFAGNPNLIGPDLLKDDGLLRRAEVPPTSFNPDRVDYSVVTGFKAQLLARAWENFQSGAAPALKQPLEEFERQQRSWLEDYALYRAIKDARGGASWYEWPAELIERKPAVLERARKDLQSGIGYHKFGQFLFYRQWLNVKKYAVEQGIRIIGDVPIFVAYDSADVWANQSIFQLDRSGKQKVVAGVPPDYFSATGQLWGNPLYDWDAVRKAGYRWWVDRIKTTLQQVDVVRLDHFRGFEAYWEVPAGRPTAEQGRWVQAPGAELFTLLRKELGGLPFIAEDLGLITPQVEALRKQFNLPGMCVLQFAFGGGNDNPYLPHNYEHNSAAYTGTHDNNTSRGWYQSAPDHEKDHLRRYLARDGSDIAWDLIRAAWASVADYAIAPLQDVMNLGQEGRMNFPGHALGNWSWRFREDQLSHGSLERLAGLTELYRR